MIHRYLTTRRSPAILHGWGAEVFALTMLLGGLAAMAAGI